MTAEDVIRVLELQPHPVEGGFFRETYRCELQLPVSVLQAACGFADDNLAMNAKPQAAIHYHGTSRALSTAIYYLLKPGTLSEMHRLPGDEVFHFYLGDPVVQLQLFPDGSSQEVTLGTDLLNGHIPQFVVPAGVWQGAVKLHGPHGFALLGATMAPGFDYSDYVTGLRTELTARWPAAAERIADLTPRG